MHGINTKVQKAFRDSEVGTCSYCDHSCTYGRVGQWYYNEGNSPQPCNAKHPCLCTKQEGLTLTPNTCLACPDGHACNGEVATKCNTNTEYVLNNVCTQCETGHRCDGNTMTKCSDAQYETSYRCFNCPPGHECNGTSKSQCSTTQYVKNNACTACPSGHQCNGAYAAACDAAQYVVNNACTACPNGHECDGTAKTACNTQNQYVVATPRQGFHEITSGVCCTNAVSTYHAANFHYCAKGVSRPCNSKQEGKMTHLWGRHICKADAFEKHAHPLDITGLKNLEPTYEQCKQYAESKHGAGTTVQKAFRDSEVGMCSYCDHSCTYGRVGQWYYNEGNSPQPCNAKHPCVCLNEASDVPQTTYTCTACPPNHMCDGHSAVPDLVWSGSDLAEDVKNMANGANTNLAAGTFVWKSTVNCGHNGEQTITLTGAGKDKTVLDAQSLRTHFVLGHGCNLVLRDLALHNGKSSGSGHGQYGGAIRAMDTVTIDATNVEFKNNEAVGGSGSGGAVYLAGSSCTGTFTGCSFISNKAGDGGGAVFLSSASATFTGCTFNENYCPNSGGAVWAGHAPAHVTFKDNSFSGNSVVHYGRTLSSYWGAKATIQSGNSFGGGCFTYDGGSIEGSCS
jgi:hypothetical protein